MSKRSDFYKQKLTKADVAALVLPLIAIGAATWAVNYFGTHCTSLGHLFPYLFMNYFALPTLPLAILAAIYLRIKHGPIPKLRSELSKRQRLESDLGGWIMALPVISSFVTKIFILTTNNVR